MSHILYLVSTLENTGPTNQLLYLCNTMNNCGHDISIITLSPEPEDSSKHRFDKLNIDFYTLGLSRAESIITGPVRLRKLVNDINPDIIHTQGIRADSLSAVFLTDYPRIATIRNYAYEDYPSKYGPVRGNLMAMAHLQALKRIEHPIACSETISQRVHRHDIGASSIQNGVDHQHYTPATESQQESLRAKLGLPVGVRMVVSVGPLIPRKDPKTVINGFTASEFDEESILVFLGDGPLLNSCREMTGDNDSIIFEGFVNNVEEYLKAADYFVSASKSEGLPNAVMEALASGLPVVLSNIGPHAEIIKDSSAGMLFETGNEIQLANKLNRLHTEDYAHSSRSARSIIEDRLNAEEMGREYERLYSNIVSE